MAKAYRVLTKLIEWRDPKTFIHKYWIPLPPLEERKGMSYVTDPNTGEKIGPFKSLRTLPEYFDVIQPGYVIYPVEKTPTPENYEAGISTFYQQKEYYTLFFNKEEVETLKEDEHLKEIDIKRYQVFIWPKKDDLAFKSNVELTTASPCFWDKEFDELKEVVEFIADNAHNYQNVTYIDVDKGDGLFIDGYKLWVDIPAQQLEEKMKELQAKPTNKKSRYFWPDGSKKLYCVKEGCGPFKEGDPKITVFGQKVKSVICKKCKDKYFENHISDSPGYRSSGKGIELHKYHDPKKRHLS